MNKILMVIGLLMIASLSFAQTTTTTTPDVTVITAGLPINISGDTIYRIKGGTFDYAIGMELASYKGLISLRAELSQSGSGSPFAGIGPAINIPKLVSLIPGANWTANLINPSIGIVGGYAFGTKTFDAGVLLSIIQVKF